MATLGTRIRGGSQAGARAAVGSGVAIATFAVAITWAGAAAGQDKAACIEAHKRGQELRNDGKLSEARDEFVTCGKTSCPQLIQQDCTQWTSEVLGILPTIVATAKDSEGRDIVDAKLWIDGKEVASNLDGRAIPLDPGVHTFRFEKTGLPPMKEQVVVRQGEKNRLVTVTLGAKPGPDPKRSSPNTTEPSKTSAPIAAYIVGGIGIATLGAALYIDLDASADARRLRDTCAPRCDDNEVSSVDSRYTLAGVTAAAGGAALIAGVVLFFLHGSSDTKATGATGVTPTFSPVAGGGVVGAGGRF